jgi:glutathionylspermidine synthase
MELRLPGAAPVRTGGSYGDSPLIYQEAVALPRLQGAYSMLGSRVIGDEPAGMILREDASPIISNASKVVPHFIAG